MKIKLLLCFFLLGTFTIANAQMIEMTPYDHHDIPSIYVGNLPQAWTTLGPRDVYTNKKKNVFVLSDTDKNKLEIKMRPNVKLMLTQNNKLKAFLVSEKWYIVNEKGEIIKKISK